jgi:hypothetical protein
VSTFIRFVSASFALYLPRMPYRNSEISHHIAATHPRTWQLLMIAYTCECSAGNKRGHASTHAMHARFARHGFVTHLVEGVENRGCAEDLIAHANANVQFHSS